MNDNVRSGNRCWMLECQKPNPTHWVITKPSFSNERFRYAVCEACGVRVEKRGLHTLVPRATNDPEAFFDD